MDLLSLILAVLLGGGGVIGAAFNGYTLRNATLRQGNLDFWDSYERQAASAERRGDPAEASRVRVQYEAQLEAFRAQQEVVRLVPPARVSPDE